MTPRYVGPSQEEYEERRAAIGQAYDSLSEADRAAVDAVCKRLQRLRVGPLSSLEIVAQVGKMLAEET